MGWNAGFWGGAFHSAGNVFGSTFRSRKATRSEYGEISMRFSGKPGEIILSCSKLKLQRPESEREAKQPVNSRGHALTKDCSHFCMSAGI